MSDSDMDIDDHEVGVHKEHTIAGESELLDRPIKASDSQNDVKKHSDEQSKIIKDSCGTFEYLDKDKVSRESGFRKVDYVCPTRSSQPNISGNSINLEDEKGGTLSRFPAPGITAKIFPSGNEPEQKRAAFLCKFFAKEWCVKGNSCRFLHVNENSNRTSQQQAENSVAGSSYIQSVEERKTSDSKKGVIVSLLSENAVTSLHTREDISLVNPQGCQRVFPFKNAMRFMSSSEIMGRESLKQKCGADVTENRKADMESSGPAWTGSLFRSIPMNEYASTLGHFESRKNIYGSGSLPTLQGISVSSDQYAEGNTTCNKKKVSSNDWEPSEPFEASFTIPPYILPSSDALYDPFTDIENLEDRSLNAPLSQKNSCQQKDGDSASGPQTRDCSNDDKNSSCSQNQHQGPVVRMNLEAHGVVEGVATSVVDQNDTTTPSKEVSLEENRLVSKRSKPEGHDSWHRSDGSSYKKMLKSDEIDGDVRSDAGMKVVRQFRTAVVETIKELLKPLWREGRLTKDVHNTIVKKAAEKVVSAAVQLRQVPTDTISVEQYLSSSATRIVKLVKGYSEKYCKV